MRSPRRTRATAPATPASDGGQPAVRAWTPAQIHALGTSTDLATAASIFGISRTQAYKLVSRGAFPVPVIRVGHTYRVPVEPIITLLRLPPPPHDHAADPDDPVGPSPGRRDPP